MDTQVLVTYATKYGATAEIADKIGQVLQQKGIRTDVHAMDLIKDLPVYHAVVLGSAVYVGRWRKEAARFLKDNEEILAKKPVWLFSSGPTGEGDPMELTKQWRFPKALQPVVDRIHPRDIALFHGKINIEKLNFLHKWMIRNVKAPIGDFRDWNAITSWAMDIAAVLSDVKVTRET